MMRVPQTGVRTRPRPEIEALSAYRLRRVTVPVKLNQNESPVDWPETVKADALRRLAAQPWHRYPPVDAAPLRDALARYCGVEPEMVAVANGSNEAILALVAAYAAGETVALTAPGYSMSQPLAVVGGARINAVRLRADFSLDVDAMVGAAQSAAVVLLASPNNPTGNAFARADIEAVVHAARGLVILDEAYANFARDSFLPDVARYRNLAVLRTCSKAFALAGARVGWIVAGGEIIETVRKTLPPYNVSLFAQQVTLAALERLDVVEERIRQIVAERSRVAESLQAIEGITPYPSEANFILFATTAPPEMISGRLLRRGVLVRDVSRVPRLELCLRVTIGTPADNDRFLDALRAAVTEGV